MELKIAYQFKNPETEKSILGPLGKNIEIIGEQLNIHIVSSMKCLMVEESANPEALVNVLQILEKLIEAGSTIKERDLLNVIKMADEYDAKDILAFYKNREIIVNCYDGKAIWARTITQKHYLDMMRTNDVIFATGSAGTGKTYVAVGYAINELKKNKIKKIIITRPAVEAGESLGFLPGDLKEKVDPYLVPIYDALDEMLGKENASKLLEKGVIEVAPLAYMRGRTLDNAFIILDEAQNTTHNQMKMFLTRLGFNSQMVITGDITQIDLPHWQESGLVEAIKILAGLKSIAMISFTKNDVMRHPVVMKIIGRYEERSQ